VTWRERAERLRDNKILQVGLKWGSFGLIVVLLVVYFQRLDTRSLATALAGVHLLAVLVAALLNLANLGFKSLFWRQLLAASVRIPAMSMFRYTVATSAASVVAPLRAGEALRLWWLRKHHGVPVMASATTAALEKLGDLAALWIIVVPLPLLLPGLPFAVRRTILVLTAIVLVGAVVVLVGRRALPKAWIARLPAVRSGRDLALGMLAILGAWMADLVSIALVLRAAGIDVPFAAAALVLLSVNLAISIPAAPANAGSLELGAVVALDMLGVPREPALAFAIAYHAMQVVPTVILGLYAGRSLSRAEPVEGTNSEPEAAGVGGGS
jgi:uncharacterized membrane protein YbhN (UPF0104 family)